MVVLFLRKLAKIFSFWNRTKKELFFIAALIILVLHYAFLSESLNFGDSQGIVKELPASKPRLVAKGVCDIPRLDPLAQDIAKFVRMPLTITCGAEDWVKCHHSKCKVTDEIQETLISVACEISDILRDEKTGFKLGAPTHIWFNETYDLVQSDHVKVSCSGINITHGRTALWSGVAMALRAMPNPPAPPAVTARSPALNVMILVFDTLSGNGFQRLMPASWKALRMELRATFLRGYSTIGDGTASALLPILTGKSDLELMDEQKDNPSILDSVQFLYRKLKERGYRTAFFEDIPPRGTVLDRLGFQDPPADHHFHKSIKEGGGMNKYCIGDTPEYKLMLNVTEQFMDLDGNRFSLTFIANLTQSHYSMVQSADDDTAASLLALKRHRKDALIVVMGDHGPRKIGVRNTQQGRLEERLPLMAIVLPTELMRRRPRAAQALDMNADVMTTPYDLHATLLDVLGLEKEHGGMRGLSLLEPIPRNRTCSDVGMEPHWCVCLSWERVAASDPMFQRTAHELVLYINTLLAEAGPKCAQRNLTSIKWVMRQIVPRLDSQENNPNYQIKVELHPTATYEATMLYIEKENRLVIRTRHISRTNMGDFESFCVADSHPHLRPFCYCQD